MRLTYDATTDVAYLSFRATGPADILGPTLLLDHDRDFPAAVALDFGIIDGRHLARITEMRLGRRVQSSRAGRPTRVQ